MISQQWCVPTLLEQTLIARLMLAAVLTLLTSYEMTPFKC
jgi:hypothetical protein